MNNVEAGKIVDRLKVAFNSHRFKEQAFTMEYMKSLLKFGYDQINAAIDRAKEEDSEWAPPVSKLIKFVRENPRQVVEVTNETHCEICDDKGYILMTQRTERYDNLPAQVVLHCICPVGLSQAYDGRNCKKGEQTPYRVPCVTEYFDQDYIEQLKKANRNKLRMTEDEREDIQKKLSKIGARMPAALDHGDAWEGDAPWE